MDSVPLCPWCFMHFSQVFRKSLCVNGHVHAIDRSAAGDFENISCWNQSYWYCLFVCLFVLVFYAVFNNNSVTSQTYVDKVPVLQFPLSWHQRADSTILSVIGGEIHYHNYHKLKVLVTTRSCIESASSRSQGGWCATTPPGRCMSSNTWIQI